MALVKITILADDKSKTAFDAAERRARNLDQAMETLKVRAAALGLATVAAVGSSLNAYANFDRGIREISTLLSDVTENDIALMGDEIKRTSIKFGQAVDAMTRAKYDIISAGFKDASDSALVLETSSKLASAGVARVSDTADILTTVLNAYGMSAAQVESVSDRLFKTVELGKTRIDLLAGSLGTVVAIAPAVGVSFDEVSAAMATLTAIGQSTDESATALQATMTSLLKPSDAMKATLKDLGFETGVAAVRALGFSETLRKLTEGANEAELAARFPNVRAMRAVFPIIGEAAGRFAQNLEDITMSAGATETAFGKMSDSAAMQIAQLKERLRVALIDLGAAFVPVLNAVTSVIEGFTSLSSVAQQLVIGLGALIVATKFLGPSILTIVTEMQAATVATTGFGVAVRGLFAAIGPVGWVIAGLSLLIPAVIALDGSLNSAAGSVQTFNKSVDGMDLQEAQTKVEDLNKELADTLKLRDDLISKSAEEFVINGRLNISGQEKIDDLNNKIAELQTKIDTVSQRELKLRGDFNIPSDVGVLSPVDVRAFDDLDRLKQSFEESTAKVQELQTELDKATARFAKFGGSYSARVLAARPVQDLTLRLKEAAAEADALKKQLDEIEVQKLLKQAEESGVGIIEVLGTVKEEVETMPPFRVPFKVDSADLLKQYEDVLESLGKQSVSLTAKANLQVITEGSVSEELQGEIGKVQKAITAIQSEINKIKPPMPQIDLGQLMPKDVPPLSFELDNASLLAAKAGIKDVNQFRVQKRREAETFLQELTLSSDEREIMALQKQLRDLEMFSDNRTELEQAVQDQIAEIRRKAREKELEEQYAAYQQQAEIVNQYVTQISAIFEQFTQSKIKGIKEELKAREDAIEREYEKGKAFIVKQYSENGQLTAKGQAELESLERNHQDRLFQVREEARRKERDAAAAEKLVKVAQAISNTAVAVTKALPNIPLAVLVGSLGAIQVGTILAQPYATGGIVGGDTSGREEKLALFSPTGSDKIPAMLSPGEAVIPADVVSQNMDVIKALLGGTATTIKSIPYRVGGLISQNPISSEQSIQSESSRPVNYYVTVNNSISSQSLDPAGAALAIQGVVESDAFVDSFRDAVNRRNLRIEVNNQPAEVK